MRIAQYAIRDTGFVAMKKTLEELARLVQSKVEGDGGVIIEGVAKVEEAKKGEITLAVSEKYLYKAKKSQISAVIFFLGG